jgi:hypothetical protein
MRTSRPDRSARRRVFCATRCWCQPDRPLADAGQR